MQEKRFITILFADIAGFTALTNTLGVERTTELINQCFERIDTIIHNCYGTVIRHEGDRVLAVFGFPRSYGNDSQNALGCALKIKQAIKSIGYNLDIHIGVGTGEAVVSREDIYGPLIDEVSHLEEIAEKGEILVNEQCYHINEHLFLFNKKAAGYELKGIVPVEPKTEFYYPCREEEQQRFENAVNKLSPYIIISGEFGAGKSSFIAEALKKVNHEGAFTIYEITFTDTAYITSGSVFTEFFTQLVPNFTPPSGEEVYRNKLFREMASALLEKAKTKPIIIVLKNIESADELTINFFEYFSSLDKDKRIVMVIETEDIGNPFIKKLLAEKKIVSEHIELKPLKMETITGLLSQLLKGYQLTDHCCEELANLSHGNIAYAIEISTLLKNFFPPGVEIKEIPNFQRLKEITEAIVDTIPEDIRSGLLLLSLLDLIDYKLFVHLISEPEKFLSYCQAKGILVVNEAKIYFKSEFLKKALQARLTKKVRQQYHRLIAQKLIENFSQPAHYGFIAFHLKEGGDLTGAYHYYKEFAQELEMRYYYQDAISVYDKILSFLNESEWEKRCAILSRKIKLLHLMGERGDESKEINELLKYAPEGSLWYRSALLARAEYLEAIADYDEALNILTALNQQKEEALILERIGIIYYNRNEFSEALKMFTRAWDLIDENVDYLQAGNILKDMGLCYWKLGEKDQALMYYLKARGYYEKAGDQVALSRLNVNIANVYYYLNKFDQAMSFYRDALNIAQKINDALFVAQILSNIGSVYVQFDEYEEALKKFEEALEIDRRKLNKKGEAIRLSNIGHIYGVLGELEKAQNYFQQALIIDEMIKNKAGMAIRYGNLATCLMLKKEYHEAINYLVSAVAISRQMGSYEYLAYYLNLLGYAYLQIDDLKKALDCLNEALTFARKARNPSYEILIQSNLGLLYLLKGELKKAYAHSSWAVENLLRIHELEGDREKVFYSHYRILWEMKQFSEAHRFLKLAYETLITRAQKIKDTEMQKKFLNLPQNKEIIDIWQTSMKKG
ncbi:MAG: tetratricopeptide repeat protein [candidate division WOR-3 bacterium]